MQKMTSFLRKLLRGQISDLAAFKQEVIKARKEHDAPPFEFERFQGDFHAVQASGLDAPSRLKAPSLVSHQATLSQHDRADWQQMDARMELFLAKLIETFRQMGVPLYVHSAFRTEAEQRELRDKGMSNMLYPMAAHCQGKAGDVVHCRFHWNMTRDEWNFIGKVGKDLAKRMGIKITWGGDWTRPWDPAHWEIQSWQNEPIYRVEPLRDDNGKRIHKRQTPRAVLARYKGTTYPFKPPKTAASTR